MEKEIQYICNKAGKKFGTGRVLHACGHNMPLFGKVVTFIENSDYGIETALDYCAAKFDSPYYKFGRAGICASRYALTETWTSDLYQIERFEGEEPCVHLEAIVADKEDGFTIMEPKWCRVPLRDNIPYETFERKLQDAIYEVYYECDVYCADFDDDTEEYEEFDFFRDFVAGASYLPFSMVRDDTPEGTYWCTDPDIPDSLRYVADMEKGVYFDYRHTAQHDLPDPEPFNPDSDMIVVGGEPFEGLIDITPNVWKETKC